MVSRSRRPAPCQDDLCPSSYASYSEVESAGPAARPLEFPSPVVRRGNRIKANTIDPRTCEICHAKNIIVRERDNDGCCDNPSIPTQGYRIVKKLSDSTYGSVHLGIVMKQRQIFYDKFASQHLRSGGTCDSLDIISEDGQFLACQAAAGMDRLTIVEDNIVWELTDEYVAIKVSGRRCNMHLWHLFGAGFANLQYKPKLQSIEANCCIVISPFPRRSYHSKESTDIVDVTWKIP